MVFRLCFVFEVDAMRQIFRCLDFIEFPRGWTGPVLEEIDFLRLDFLNVERSRYQVITLSLSFGFNLWCSDDRVI